jgi:hypothetical protein
MRSNEGKVAQGKGAEGEERDRSASKGGGLFMYVRVYTVYKGTEETKTVT